MEKISSIELNDPESVILDDGKKSMAFFCKRQPIKVDFELINKLKGVMANTSKNVRLCLHESPEAYFHNMVVLERKGKYYRPHKHEDKGESFQMIEGSMAVFTFDENGKIIDSCVLQPDKNFLYKVGNNMFHTIMPLSDIIIYHESKPGPFKIDKDSIYPSWAPDGNNEEEVEEYKKRLYSILNFK